MRTKTNSTNRWLTLGLSLTAAGAFALISACGGGGDVSFNGGTASPTPTATATPTSTPTPLPFAELHIFAADGSEGLQPLTALVADGAGNFYGTTYEGGVNNKGTAFKITSAGVFTLLHTFAGGANDAAKPRGELVADGTGNFYGTSNIGGVDETGTVFKMDPAGNVTVVHSFDSYNHGAFPYAGLVFDGTDTFYGTTTSGGLNGVGSAFKITNAGVFTPLNFFAAVGDGVRPDSGLVDDGSGNFYGVTPEGGANNKGTVFKITSAGVLTTLHSFAADGSDGAVPETELLGDGAGNFYGTTFTGGANNMGTVFKITDTGTFTPMHSFAGGSADGEAPIGKLVADGSGNLYGTTYLGGANSVGTVYKIKIADNTVTVLHTFAVDGGGFQPLAGLVSDGAGNLYGTTAYGGTGNNGAVFRVPMQ